MNIKRYLITFFLVVHGLILHAQKMETIEDYNAMYNPKDVMKKAIKDLYHFKKDVSCFGFVNNSQKILTKLLPHKLVMKIWMNQQKLDGTPNIR